MPASLDDSVTFVRAAGVALVAKYSAPPALPARLWDSVESCRDSVPSTKIAPPAVLPVAC